MSLPRPTRVPPSIAVRPAAPVYRAPSAGEPLDALRADFLAAVARDTPGTDLARYTAVLDEVLAWSTAGTDRGRLVPATPTAAAGVIAFAPASGDPGPRWSVRPVRGGGPVIEVAASAGDLQDAQVARIRAVFGAHSRAAVGAHARPRIGFSALKNPAARAALFELLEELLRAGAPAPVTRPTADEVTEAGAGDAPAGRAVVAPAPSEA